jgi:GTP-binding protein
MAFNSAEFVYSIGPGGEFPADGRVEWLLAGRSNVGKSSLINALTNRRELARVSSTPGRTRALIFFLINESFYLVDPPGYGYARLSKTERQSFAKLLDRYLSADYNPRRALLLADGRHDPMESDLDAAHWLSSRGLEYRLVLTKIDEVKPRERKARVRAMADAFELSPEFIYCTSARTKEGVDELCRAIMTQTAALARRK